MPEVTGVEIVKKVKSKEPIKHIPVVILSVGSNFPLLEDVLQLENVHYMSKPDSISDFHILTEVIISKTDT